MNTIQLYQHFDPSKKPQPKDMIELLARIRQATNRELNPPADAAVFPLTTDANPPHSLVYTHTPSDLSAGSTSENE
ncbi:MULTISPECIES: hypothetical protein [Rhizobium]|jgi:hypothetical protein|uniref:hypothetical protein n=1 Tax=Rhizobium TaxID=379 RepID=UPI00056BC816|nr:hypothetical protein [Rhizobium lusitanum]NTJ11035.1 hypothetical protein [Rhizobium lusitanum]